MNTVDIQQRLVRDDIDGFDGESFADHVRGARPRVGAEVWTAMHSLRQQVLGGPPRIEASFGRYRWTGVLGRGGGGVVFAARDPELGRDVALKLVHVQGDERMAQLQREARALASVRHPAVVPIYDVGTYDTDDDAVRSLVEFFGLPPTGLFIAMELVRGQTLARWRADADRPLNTIVEVMRQVAAGVVALHRAGLVHRDIKPANIMVDEDGRARLMDLGVAQRIELDVTSRVARPQTVPMHVEHPTRASVAVGTPIYMAPEQHRAGQSTGPAVDQYGLCATLWEAVHGVRPFEGSTLAELSEAKQGPPTVGPGVRVPRWLDRVMRRGLAELPADRFASMEALHDRLQTSARIRRRRVIGVSLVGAAAAVALMWASGDVVPACAPGTEQLAGIWDGPVRRDVRRALHAHGAPNAPPTWKRVRYGLDDYAARWALAWDGLCSDEGDAVARSTRGFDGRVRCLGDRRRRLRAVVELLQRPVPLGSRRVLKLVGGLASLEACDSSLGWGVPLPADPQVVARVDLLRGALARARGLWHAGELEAADQLVLGVQREATELDYSPLTIEARIERGRTSAALGHHVLGAERLREGLQGAMALGMDATAATAVVELVHVLSEGVGDYDGAIELAENNLPWIEQQYDPHTVGDLLGNLGNVYLRRGEPAQALHLYERSLASYRRASAHLSTVGAMQVNLGMAHASMGQHDTGLDVLRQAISTLEEALGPEHPATADAVSNVGLVHVQRGELEPGERALRRALTSYERLGMGDASSAVSIRNNLGVVQLERGRFSAALDSFLAVVAVFEGEHGREHPRLADFLENVGSARLGLGDAKAAAAAFGRALAIREAALGHEHPAVANSLSGVGRSRLALGEVNEAREPLMRARVLCSTQAVPADVCEEIEVALSEVQVRSLGG